ncbi:hypothetical protein [Ferrimonas futtsuensis]|uniref:hypothetical protein n=1 Tax=Ferrimonas futtsuensis TaxID=364764 RepID=UPI00048071C0|nr:hypothetical protein [Ferrimonas futtsuensis]
MPLGLWRRMQAGLAMFVVAASMTVLVIYLQDHKGPRQWCARQGCLSQQWVGVAERVVASELYVQANDPAQLLNLFLSDLGSLQHQKGAVYQFLLLTLDKDPRFAAIASAMLLNGYRTDWKFAQESQLKAAVMEYWHDHPGDGYWQAMLTGAAPRPNWSPTQLDAWARHHGQSEYKSAD